MAVSVSTEESSVMGTRPVPPLIPPEEAPGLEDELLFLLSPFMEWLPWRPLGVAPVLPVIQAMMPISNE